jgi:hypothetical protein
MLIAEHRDVELPPSLVLLSTRRRRCFTRSGADEASAAVERLLALDAELPQAPDAP